jgi:hypothetical protein
MKTIIDWKLQLRRLLKAAVLFILLNVLFALTTPLEALGRLSLYNTLLPGRERFPYGENPAESYNLSLNNILAMFASHTISRPKAEDEYRVILIGDSGTWGWLLENEETMAGLVNSLDYVAEDGQKITAYNLGYPILSLSKDLLILDEAMNYEPDMIIWLVTLESFPREKQLTPPLVLHNPERMASLVEQYDLAIDMDDDRFVRPSFLEQTIVGQRRPLADLLRLQLYGFSWMATGIDQAIPEEITLRQSDFEADISWHGYEEPQELEEEELALDVLAAGFERVGDVPILLVNEPMFVSVGQNSDLRYNSFYPRWAYDSYRDWLAAETAENGWNYIDLSWRIPGEHFSDTPVHLMAEGMEIFTVLLFGRPQWRQMPGEGLNSSGEDITK